MSKAISEVAMLWRLARVKMILFSCTSLWTCWATSTASLDMTKLGAWEWSQTIGGCLCAWGLTMMALVDKSAGQIAAGHVPGIDIDPPQDEVKP